MANRSSEFQKAKHNSVCDRTVFFLVSSGRPRRQTKCPEGTGKGIASSILTRVTQEKD